jgi:hypothetical protein
MRPRHGFQKVLIVEGVDDKHSVIGLMRSHVDWPEEKARWPVYVELGNSASEILEPAFLTTHFKEAGVTTVGIMLDADSNPSGRYQSIRNTSSKFFADLPETLPAGGLVARNPGGMRMGVWIMPDNLAEGCLETFLRYLVPNSEETIWKLAVDSVQSAKAHGASCPDKDTPKSNLYTWLAWQNPPGQQPGLALTKHILNPKSTHAEPFVKWFRELYEL